MSSLGSPVALLKALLVRIPLLLKTVILHTIHMSPVSGKQDLRTELTVTIIRSFLDSRVPVSKQQKGANRDPGIKGRIWISKVTFPQPETAVQDAVVKAIDELKVGGETYDIPGVAPVEAEWTGYRSGVGKNEPQPDISEEQKYEELKKENKEDMVILYFHGGAYYLMDPCTHRATTAQLSKHTGAPVLSVRYRLAPQHPFPSALVDAVVAYLSLVSPPPGSLHKPIPPSKIVLAGDSAGGNLALVLLQTLLTLKRLSHTIRFHNRDIPIDTTPAGVALSSPWCDITRSMPSIIHNAKYDYLPPPHQTPQDGAPWAAPAIPEDNVWPAAPPRVDYFANSTAIIHPLVSPLATPSHLWSGAPPIYIALGEEALTDEDLVLARSIHRAGAPVLVDQFEGMPHCFGLVMLGSAVGQRYHAGMASFSRDAVAGTVQASGALTFLESGLQTSREIPIEKITPLTDEEVQERLQVAAQWRLEAEKELQRRWETRARL